MRYDYLIVGAGLFGAVFAHEAHKRGKKCLVIDRRDHIAGNAYTESIEGINVHKYGAHIFHTSNKEVWEYVNQFADFNHYINSPVAVYGDELYNLPFNMNTFSKMWGIKTPAEAKAIIAEQVAKENIDEPKNLEKIITVIDELDWYSAQEEGFGDLYEGLLEKNAGEKKSGAGQYFTPRVLIDVMVRLMKPQPGLRHLRLHDCRRRLPQTADRRIFRPWAR